MCTCHSNESGEHPPNKCTGDGQKVVVMEPDLGMESKHIYYTSSIPKLSAVRYLTYHSKPAEVSNDEEYQVAKKHPVVDFGVLGGQVLRY